MQLRGSAARPSRDAADPQNPGCRQEPRCAQLPAVNKAAQIAKGLGAQLTLFHDIATPLYARRAGPTWT